MEKADLKAEKVCAWTDNPKKETEALAQEEQRQFHKTKLDMQAEIQTAPHPQQVKTLGNMQTKLPKLVITKFDGSFVDWPRF